MKKLSLIMSFVLLIGLSSCVESATIQESSDNQLQRKTEQSMQEMNRQIGMPAIKNFQERKLAKMIFELRDKEKLVTYAYIVAKNTGRLVFVGKCIGFGLPYSVQYTNPEKEKFVDGGDYGAINPYTLPQADPNGLFMPSGLSATWLMMINPKTGQPQPVYFEPEIIVSPFPLHGK